MDPNETLTKARAIANRMFDGESEPDSSDASDLAELFLALDLWMMAGGFIPSSWLQHRS